MFIKEEPFLFGCASMWYLVYSKSGAMMATADKFAEAMKVYNRLTNGHGAGAAAAGSTDRKKTPFTPTGTVTLDWSAAAKASMSVTADSYSGTVKLDKDFCIRKDDDSLGAVFAATGGAAISDALRDATGGVTLMPCDAHDITIEGTRKRRPIRSRSPSKKTKATLAVGKTSAIKASIESMASVKKALSHDGMLRYYSSDRHVATVTSEGRIKARSVGNCTVYAVASSGVCAKVK